MNSLDTFFEQIDNILSTEKFKGCPLPVFRGHSREIYSLLPTLHRDYKKTGQDLPTLENNLYCDFKSLVGPRLSFKTSWETIFLMRHEGIPTRLLDWTENLGTALFFSLDSEYDKPHIWILNPYKLNQKDSLIGEALVDPEEDFPKQYHETYAELCNDPSIPINNFPVAIYPKRSNDRIFAQRGLFTIHGSNNEPMENSCSDCLEKIEIPVDITDKLKKLIKNFGINKYSVYPDLKGLSDHLKQIYNY